MCFLRQVDGTRVRIGQVASQLFEEAVAELVVVAQHGGEYVAFHLIDHGRLERGYGGVIGAVGDDAPVAERVAYLEHADDLHLAAYALLVHLGLAGGQHHHVRGRVAFVLDDFVLFCTAA